MNGEAMCNEAMSNEAMSSSYLTDIRRQLSDAEYEVLEDAGVSDAEHLYVLVDTFPNLSLLGLNVEKLSSLARAGIKGAVPQASARASRGGYGSGARLPPGQVGQQQVLPARQGRGGGGARSGSGGPGGSGPGGPGGSSGPARKLLP